MKDKTYLIKGEVLLLMIKKFNAPKLRFPGFTDEWEQRKLGEIGKWYKGIGGTKDDLNTKQSGRMFVHYADLYQTSEFLSNVVHWTINETIGSLIAPNSILFPMSDVTPYGLARTTSCKLKDVRAGGDVLINTIDTNIDSDFVSIYINLFSKNILPFVTGTTVKHINSKSLSELTILIPSFEEQVKIVNLVKFYNEIITLHQRKLNHLILKKKSLLQKLFPKNGGRYPELRFPGFTDAWEQRKLSEVVTINPKTELPDEFKYVDLESVVGTNLLGFQVIKKENAPSRAQRLASYGDVFYQTVRPYQRNNYLFENIDKDMVFSTGYAQLRSKLDSYFLLTLVQNDNFVKVVLDNCTGTSYPAINGSELGKITVQIPSNDAEANQIGKVFRGIDNIITLHQ